MTAYFVGDVPADVLVVEPARGGLAIDLAPFDTVTVVLRGPDLAPVDDHGITAAIDTDTVEVTWPGASVFDAEGIYEIELTLEAGSGGSALERVSPIRIVVEEQGTGWYTLDLARHDWADAPDPTDFDDDGDIVLWTLLQGAIVDVTTYAPTLAADAPPPLRYRQAQLMHARNVWNVDKGDAATVDMGLGPFVYRPRPLDRSIMQLLRPKNPRPAIA